VVNVANKAALSKSFNILSTMFDGAQTLFREGGNLASRYCPVRTAHKARESVANMPKRQVAVQKNLKLCYRWSIALALLQQSVSWSKAISWSCHDTSTVYFVSDREPDRNGRPFFPVA
jgi:hypothetical protein